MDRGINLLDGDRLRGHLQATLEPLDIASGRQQRYPFIIYRRSQH
jgi:hypothetical protein